MYRDRLLLGIGRIGMKTIVVSLLTFILSWFRSRRSMQMAIVSIRYQSSVYQRSGHRSKINPADRVIWSWIVRRWSGWREALIFVQPRTVMAWQKNRFRVYRTKLSGARKVGHPALSKEVRALIVKMSNLIQSWDSLRIVGELRKLGYRGIKVDCREILGKRPQTALTNMESLSG
jgi:hypothetical protein